MRRMRAFRRQRCNGIVKKLSLAESVELRGLETRVVNPELRTVGDRNAGRVAFEFAPEFVWRLKGDDALSDKRLGEQVSGFLFGEIGRERWKFRAMFLELLQKSGGVGGGELRSGRNDQ